MNKSHIFLLLVLTLVFSCKEAKKDVEEKITELQEENQDILALIRSAQLQNVSKNSLERRLRKQQEEAIKQEISICLKRDNVDIEKKKIIKKDKKNSI